MFKEFTDSMKSITKAFKDMDKVSSNKIKSGVIGKDVKPKFFDKMDEKEIKPRHISTINENMKGKSINDVKYDSKEIKLNGEKYEGVFPQFKSKIDIYLPKELQKASDAEQMRYCTKEVAKRVDRDPNFAKKFTPRQLEQIRKGEPRISGLTWHHNEEPGKMQLVDADKHSAARHTGGRSLWGGGSDSR